ncbi:MAG: hypothetical protein M3068_07000 [Gemmatimonadota bacterium]|nr:hypothetical protein [Gemmatimonadota bacterium]
MPLTALRPRTGAEIIDAAFQLFRQHYAQLVTLTAVTFAPYIIVQFLMLGGRRGEMSPGRTLATVSLLIVALIIGSLSEAATMIAVADGYLGRPVDAGAALQQTFSQALPIVLASLRKWIFVGLGFALFLGPGIYLYAQYFAVPAVIVLEKRGVGDAFRRTRQLSQGEKRKILGTLGLATLVYFIFQLIVGSMLTSLVGNPAIGTLLQQVFTILVYPLISVISTLMYYDVRIRKEAYDIEVMSAELGVATAGQPA